MSRMIAALLLVAPWATVAAAQDTTTKQMPPTDTITGQVHDGRDGPQSDDAVLMRMHRTNQLEIRVGRLAQRNGGSARVKSFGAQLARDHAAADQKVMALGKKLGVRWDAGTDLTHRADTAGYRADTAGHRADTAGRMGWKQPGDTTQRGQMGHHEMKDHEQLVQRLSTLRGAQFDSAFANAMVQGHDKTIGMLERAQGQVQNAELRTLIANTLPTVRQHRQVAQSLGGRASTTSSIQ